MGLAERAAYDARGWDPWSGGLLSGGGWLSR